MAVATHPQINLPREQDPSPDTFPKHLSFITGAVAPHRHQSTPALAAAPEPPTPKLQSKLVASSDLTGSQQIFPQIIKQGHSYFILLLKSRSSNQTNEPTKAAEIKNLLKLSSTFPVWLQSRHFMAGTLCLADVQLTAFQAYKKLIRLKIEFVTINCQEHRQHFQPRTASRTTAAGGAGLGQVGVSSPSQDLVWVGRVTGEGSRMGCG